MFVASLFGIAAQQKVLEALPRLKIIFATRPLEVRDGAVLDAARLAPSGGRGARLVSAPDPVAARVVLDAHSLADGAVGRVGDRLPRPL